jgi:hypothetical protein
MRLAVEYVLALRWDHDDADAGGLAELTGYLRWLSMLVDVTVVDGSPPEVYHRHAASFGAHVRHLPPSPDLRYLNGKVNGVVTGLRQARHEHVVVADDDVRYDEAGLRAVDALLARHDLVRPQNYFRPLPWHARWDTARTLVNRGFGVDYPGTLGVRRKTFEAIGGYDGDVLFENLELIRTIRAGGGSEAAPLDLYVRRLPPPARRFWSQRVRQAYDDLAQPGRLLAFLAIGPIAVAAVAAGRPWVPAAIVGGSLGLAGRGRARGGGAAVYPASATLLAPVWLTERAVCVWLAVALRLTRGGVRYAGQRVRVAAHSTATLARRMPAARSAAGIPAG